MGATCPTTKGEGVVLEIDRLVNSEKADGCMFSFRSLSLLKCNSPLQNPFDQQNIHLRSITPGITMDSDVKSSSVRRIGYVVADLVIGLPSLVLVCHYSHSVSID